MNSGSSNPFALLQENSSLLFEKIFAAHSKEMLCKNGCFRCCEAEFSVHPGEAALIVDWFFELSDAERIELIQKWGDETPAHSPRCAFLIAGSCSIYPARPIICRTQGAPLCISDEVKKTKELTACHLNFKGGETIPKNQNHWFELNRLTELQSIAQNFYKNSVKNDENIEFSKITDSEGRIPLRKIQERLKFHRV